MIPSHFSYSSPATIAEAIALLERHGDEARLLAGGHSLLPIMKQRFSDLSHLIDLGRIRDLSAIRLEGNIICIGAMTTHSAIADSELLAGRQPLLPQAAAKIGDVQTRNRGTIGGSLAHADPAADLIPVMLVLEAEMVIAGASGTRMVTADVFFEGMYTTALADDEILTEIRVPAAAENSRSVYRKASHKASHLAVVGVAAEVYFAPDATCESARIALTGLAPIAYRAQAAERVLRGKAFTSQNIEAAAALVTDGIDPLGDHYAPADYRSQLAKVHTTRALAALGQP